MRALHHPPILFLQLALPIVGRFWRLMRAAIILKKRGNICLSVYWSWVLFR